MSAINIPRPVTVAVRALTPLVDLFRELDARLSIRFVDLDESRFDEVCDAMHSYGEWSEVGEWEDMHEYTYAVGPAAVQTNVYIRNSVSLSHAVHSCVESLDLRVMNHGLARGSVDTETAVDPADIPETVTPSTVRIRKRKTFCRDPWKFHVSRVWTGGSRSVVEEAQSKGETVYDICIEFSPDASYWNSPRHTSTYVATSMLMKMVDIVSPEMVSVEPVPKGS